MLVGNMYDFHFVDLKYSLYGVYYDCWPNETNSNDT